MSEESLEQAGVHRSSTNYGDRLGRYGHPMPGNEAEAAELLDAYLKFASKGA